MYGGLVVMAMDFWLWASVELRRYRLVLDTPVELVVLWLVVMPFYKKAEHSRPPCMARIAYAASVGVDACRVVQISDGRMKQFPGRCRTRLREL